MEFHQTLGYTRPEVILMLTAEEILEELRNLSAEDLKEFHRRYLDFIKRSGLETSFEESDDRDAQFLKQLEEIDEKWQEATGYPWLDGGDYQKMVKKAGQGVCEPDVTIEDLLTGITPENVHEEIRTGKPRGKEVW